jgi:hypothetical protein
MVEGKRPSGMQAAGRACRAWYIRYIADEPPTVHASARARGLRARHRRGAPCAPSRAPASTHARGRSVAGPLRARRHAGSAASMLVSCCSCAAGCVPSRRAKRRGPAACSTEQRDGHAATTPGHAPVLLVRCSLAAAGVQAWPSALDSLPLCVRGAATHNFSRVTGSQRVAMRLAAAGPSARHSRTEDRHGEGATLRPATSDQRPCDPGALEPWSPSLCRPPLRCDARS